MFYFTQNEKKKQGSYVLASSLTASNTKRANLVDMITLRNEHCGHSWHDNPWPWVSLIWLYNLQLWHHGRWFRKFTACFRPFRKELQSSMYNNNNQRPWVFDHISKYTSKFFTKSFRYASYIGLSFEYLGKWSNTFFHFWCIT